MKRKHSVLKCMVIVIALLTQLTGLPAMPVHAATEAYDTLRSKTYDMVTGGPTFSTTDPDIAIKISAITSNAQTYWDTLNKGSNVSLLWDDLDFLKLDTNGNLVPNSADVSACYARLEAMSLAYTTRGSGLQNNAAMLADILVGLDWMNTHKYNKDTAYRAYDNWFDWQISCPLSLNNMMVMLYPSLSATQINAWSLAMDKQALDMNSASLNGANRVWACNIQVVQGIVTQNDAKIIVGRDNLTPVLKYVTSGEGFYADGSFIQHTANIPYNGGYGINLIDNLTKVMYLLAGSAWDLTDPNVSNIYQWVYNAFEPFFYHDMMMEMVMGRNVSRYGNDGKGVTTMGNLGAAVVRMALSAPLASDRENYKSMVKKWMQQATSTTPYADLSSIFIIEKTKQLMSDSAIVPRGELVFNRQYPSMARTVHRRPGFAFGISMFNNVVSNYELINNENLKGWHTGSGMTYLYNDDLTQYKDAFWPTVNSYRLPRTTVEQNTATTDDLAGPYSWVGGTDVSGLYGVTGMMYKESDLLTANKKSVVEAHSLVAKKSWFMFDDEIVCLGSGITASDNKVVETVVDNRKLNSAGNNTLTVNGSAKSSALGWSETMTGVSWAHLAGNVAGADVGYYFPSASTVKGLREARTGQWSSVNMNDPTNPDYLVNYTRDYMNLWFDHGNNPSDATYAYALLPGKSAAQMSTYAASPNFTVVENSADAQAVRENTLGVLGVNFWNDMAKTVDIITTDKKASVMTRTSTDEIELSVSDPSETGNIIDLGVNLPATGVLSCDPGITVTQLQPTIKLKVNVLGANGKGMKVRFSRNGAAVPLASVPVAGDNLALNKTVTASSTYSSTAWNLTKAVDGIQTTTPASSGWTSSSSLTTNHSEWLTVDLGAARSIGRVDLYPRNDSINTGYGFPVDFTIQTSTDNASWTTVMTQTGYPLPGSSAQVFTFPAVTGRYVRINGTSLRPNPADGYSYRMQLGEVEVYAPVNLALGKTVTASSTYSNSDWNVSNVTDAREFSLPGTRGWTSNSSLTVNHSEWVTVDLGAVRSVGRVDLFPRTDDVNIGQGFPVDFTIQLSTDNSNWTTVATRSGYPLPEARGQSFEFASAGARYIRVNGTSLRPNPNDSGNYRMQFAEIEVYPGNLAAGKTVTASSTVTNTSWGVSRATDGQRVSQTGSMGWTSNNTLTADHSEWMTVDLGTAQNIGRVVLYPRTDSVNAGYGFPVNFTIQVSNDNSTWTTLVTKTGYPLISGAGQGFTCNGTSARYIRVNATSLRANPSDNSNYRMQIAEMEVFN